MKGNLQIDIFSTGKLRPL